MDKIIDALGKLLPLVSYFPRWAQIVLSLSFASVLASAMVFVTMYPAAARAKAEAEAGRSLPPDVRARAEADVKEATGLYGNLGLALSDYYAAATALRVHLLDHTKAHPNVQSYTAQ